MKELKFTNGVHEDCKHKMPSAIKKSLLAKDGVWTDVSWGNDEFASFTNEENGWQLRMGDPNPLVRWGGHQEDSPRGYLVAFNVYHCEPEEGDLEQVYESDDFEMLAQIASNPTPRARAWKHFINSKQQVFVEETDTVIDDWKVKVFKPHFSGTQKNTGVSHYFYLFDGNLKHIDPDDESTFPPHITSWIYTKDNLWHESEYKKCLTLGNEQIKSNDMDYLEHSLFEWSIKQGLLDNFLVFKRDIRKETIKLDDLTHDCVHAMYEELAKCLPKITEGHVNPWHQGRIESAISEAILDWVQTNDHNNKYLIKESE